MEKIRLQGNTMPHCKGIGLCRIHSCINHSCLPNSAILKDKEEKNAYVTVVALKPIKKDEEITISYFDFAVNASRIERQKQLKGQYPLKKNNVMVI